MVRRKRLFKYEASVWNSHTTQGDQVTDLLKLLSKCQTALTQWNSTKLRDQNQLIQSKTNQLKAQLDYEDYANQAEIKAL